MTGMGEFLSQLARWLCPRICGVCGNETGSGGYLCPSCVAGFSKPERPLCFRCGEPFAGSFADEADCPHCRGHERHYDFARACYINEGDARKVVLDFKYGGRIYLRHSLAEGLAALWDEYGDVLRDRGRGGEWRLVPVPLHFSKLSKRGYNQSEELAVGLSKLTGLKVINPLTRKKDALSQTSLTRKERFEHVRFLYEVKAGWLKKKALEGVCVLLIDDVMTTGSTAEVCARELKKAGAAVVGVLSVLRSCTNANSLDE